MFFKVGSVLEHELYLFWLFYWKNYAHIFKDLCMYLDIHTKDKSIQGTVQFYTIYGKISEMKF